jgi:predicted nucleic acid-binding protein
VTFVIDASVAIKWVIRDPAAEPGADKAMAILRAIRARSLSIVQPPHWMLEVLAVIARERPQRAALTLGILETLPYKVVAPLVCYRWGIEFAIRFRQHLFDTLYHAVALEHGATLLTADEAYFARAKDLGSIVRLADFAV